MRPAFFVLVAVFALSTEARADRGALTLDLGGGATILMLPAPYAPDSPPLPTSTWLSRLGLRYAISDEFEVAFSGFFEPRVTAFHHGVTVDTSQPGFPGPDAGRGSFRGTLTHNVQRLGATLGARYVLGSIFRWHLGADLGWSLRTYGDFTHIDTRDGGARSHGIRIEDFSASSLIVAPIVGLEWAFHDKWSVSIMPRMEILMGPNPMIAFSIPIMLSTSWYI